MADFPPKKNTAFTWYFFIRDNDGDLVAGATGLDVEFSIDGGAFADVAGVEVDEGGGLYSCPIAAGEMNGDVIALVCKTSTVDAKTAAQVVYTVARQNADLAFPATSGRSLQVEADGMVHADLKEWLGLAPLALDTQRVQALAVAIAADAINAAAIATGAIDADAIAAAAITSSEAPALANLDAAVSTRATPADVPTAAVIADAVLDEDMTAHQTQGSLGQAIGDPGADTDTLWGLANAFLDAAVSSRLATAGYTAPDNAGIDDIQARLPAALVGGRIDASVGAMAADIITAAALAADAAIEIADALLKRDVDQVEATAPKHSLTTAILKAVARLRDNAGTLEIYRTDGVTLHATQAVTTDATLQPVDELGTAA